MVSEQLEWRAEDSFDPRVSDDIATIHAARLNDKPISGPSFISGCILEAAD